MPFPLGATAAPFVPINAFPSPDRPDSFDNRFGDWGSAPAAGSGNPRSPVLRALQNYKRSAAPDGPASTSAQGAPPATPAFQPDIAGKRDVPVLGKFIGDRLITRVGAASPPGPMLSGSASPNLTSEESPFGDRSENALGGPRPDNYPRLPSRRASSAFPGITPPDLDRPMPPPERAPPLGIFSGKPMSTWPFPTPLGGLPDNSDASGNGRGNRFTFLAGGSGDSRESEASVFDTRASAVPFVPSGNPNSVSGLANRIAALAGAASVNPALPAPPPQDDAPRELYDGDPTQPWFVQAPIRRLR
jgi:hypothetical protein